MVKTSLRFVGFLFCVGLSAAGCAAQNGDGSVRANVNQNVAVANAPTVIAADIDSTNASSSVLETAASDAETAEMAKPFSKKLSLHGITFTVTSPNSRTKNTVTIKPQGLTETNEAMTSEIDGTVTGAEVNDLDEDFSPEIYVFVKGNGAEKPGALVAYAANKKKSLSQIYLPEIAADSKQAIGYRGGDEFGVGEATLLKRFPIYQEKNGKWQKTDKWRQFQYKLKPGEAGWQLALDRVTEF